MSGWISKATTLLGGKKREPERPQPFDIACSCGNSVSGYREPGSQVARCNRCGDRLFVLPKDVYPQPRAKQPPPEAVPDQSPKSEPNERRSAPREVEDTPAARAARKFRDAAKSKPEPQVSQKPREPKLSFRERTRVRVRRTIAWQLSLFTPFRLMLLAIFGVIAVTGYWGWSVRRAELAAAIVQRVTNEGDEAVSRGDFNRAAEKYSEAWKAHQILKRDDAEARRVHQAFLETTAASRLISASPFDILAEAQQKRKAEESGWETSLESRYRDSWIVIDSSVFLETGVGNSPHTQVDCPLMLDDTPLAIETDADVYDRLHRGGDSKRAIFAAQVSGFRFVSADEPRWVLTLKGDSVFAWSNPQTFEKLGLMGLGPDAVEATRKILAEQSQRLEIEP